MDFCWFFTIFEAKTTDFLSELSLNSQHAYRRSSHSQSNGLSLPVAVLTAGRFKSSLQVAVLTTGGCSLAEQ